jgi:RecB family exonuclease
MNRIKAWSFSILKDFEACPYRAYLHRVEKSPLPAIDDDPDHPLTRGNRIHKTAEAFIRGEGEITHELHRVAPLLGELREAYTNGQVELEKKWAFDREWGTTDWTAEDCWLRVICDVVEHFPNHTARVRDWKTGKSLGNELKHQQQQQLYAIATFLRYPHLTHVQTTMEYTDEGKQKVSNYTREALPALMQRWTERGLALTNAIAFPPKPNRGNCRYCPFGPDNGTGACPYGVSQNS